MKDTGKNTFLDICTDPKFMVLRYSNILPYTVLAVGATQNTMAPILLGSFYCALEYRSLQKTTKDWVKRLQSKKHIIYSSTLIGAISARLAFNASSSLAVSTVVGSLATMLRASGFVNTMGGGRTTFNTAISKINTKRIPSRGL